MNQQFKCHKERAERFRRLHEKTLMSDQFSDADAPRIERYIASERAHLDACIRSADYGAAEESLWSLMVMTSQLHAACSGHLYRGKAFERAIVDMPQFVAK